jgi:hypothetical protein
MIPNFDTTWSVILYVVGLAVCAVVALVMSFRVKRIEDVEAASSKADLFGTIFVIYFLAGGLASMIVTVILSNSLLVPLTAIGIAFAAIFAAVIYVDGAPSKDDSDELQGFATLRACAIFLSVNAALLGGFLMIFAPSLPKVFFYSADGTKVVTFYRGDGYSPLESEVRNPLVGAVNVKTSGRYETTNDPAYEWVERTGDGEVRSMYRKPSSDFGAYLLLDSTDETPVNTWVSDVEVVSDLKPGEAPYVVHQISFEVPKSYDGKTPICTRYHSDRSNCSVNAKGAGSKATIHIPEDSYNEYVKVSS